MITISQNPVPAPAATPLVATGTPATSSSLPSLSFGDVVDALNPLQHIPVVSSVYRAATGSNISSVSEIAGDALYGSLTGNALVSVAASVGDVAVKQITGASLLQNVENAYHAITAPGSTVGKTTALVADSPLQSQAIVAQASAQDTSSSSSALANAGSANAFFKSLQTNASVAQYQRAQTLDAANKMLIKMAV